MVHPYLVMGNQIKKEKTMSSRKEAVKKMAERALRASNTTKDAIKFAKSMAMFLTRKSDKVLWKDVEEQLISWGNEFEF